MTSTPEGGPTGPLSPFIEHCMALIQSQDQR